jgi:gluconokinase
MWGRRFTVNSGAVSEMKARTVSMVNASPGRQPVLVLMGVSGCGKSTVAGLLAGRLGWDFEEGDDLHPAANVAKMASGHQLDDEDRWPWLAKVAEWIGEHTDVGRPGIITCSALKRSYRDVLRGRCVVFVYLAGTREQIGRRLAARHGHYMPAALLDSQFDALEPPTPEESSITVEIGASASIETDAILSRLGLSPKASTQAEE